jgi:hypothetical protein
MQLIQHLYHDAPARYYINSVRVSKQRYEYQYIRAGAEGKKVSCFLTKCKHIGEGNYHRINYTTIED